VLFNREISIPLGKAVNALCLNPFAITGCLPPGLTDSNLTIAPELLRSRAQSCSAAPRNPLSDREPVRNWMSEEV
jgi:hypothetical protein